MTQAEWDQYIRDALPYQKVCKALPIESEAVLAGAPINTATLAPLDANTPANSETQGLKSGNGSVETTLNLSNNSGNTLKLNWVDFEGAEQAFMDITNGEATVSTFNTHIWRIRDLSGSFIFEYTATDQPIQEIIINTDLTVTVK